MKYTFEIYRDKTKNFRWRLKHRNGNILCCSGEGYKRKQSLKKIIPKLGLAFLFENTVIKDLSRVKK